MAIEREHFALDWIKADLLETLNHARVALDEYAENSADEMRMRTCLTSLHQVHGTLVMLELQGVTQLADHLEQLAQAMLTGAIQNTDQAGQFLMQGILELPGYLDELQRGAEDNPATCLPLVNDIRGVLNLELIPDTGGSSLTTPPSDEAVQRYHAIEGPQKVARIRSAYQNVLLSILKGEDRRAAVVTLSKIAVGLQRVSSGSPLERQWQAFAEFVTSLSYRSGVLESEAVKLLRRVDVEIKNLAKDGDAALRQPVNVELVKQLLNAALERNHTSDTIAGLQQAVDRDVTNNTLAISGRQAMASAAVALREELARVKDKLDLIMRANSVDFVELRGLLEPLKQMGSTLSLLGFESSREIVSDQIDAIESLAVLGDTDPQNIASIAGALIQIDENLSGVAQGSEKSEVEQITSDAQVQVLRESRAGLDLVKQGIVDFVSTQWDTRLVENLPQLLREICGALEIIPLTRVIELLKDAHAYIDNHLNQGHKPAWQELDLFADGISAVDYYLERLAEKNVTGVDDILLVAQRSFADLKERAQLAHPDQADLQSSSVASNEMPANAHDNEQFDLSEPSALTQAEVSRQAPAILADKDAGQTPPQVATASADDEPLASPLLESSSDADIPSNHLSETDPALVDFEAQAEFEQVGQEKFAAELIDDTAARLESSEDFLGAMEGSMEGAMESAVEGTDSLDIPAELSDIGLDSAGVATDLPQVDDLSSSAGIADSEPHDLAATEERPIDDIPVFTDANFSLEDSQAFDLGADTFAHLDDLTADEHSSISSAEDVYEEFNDTETTVDTGSNEIAAVDTHPDPEIVEIFIEEVTEVLDNLDHWLPQWALDLGSSQNAEPITEIRRGFHTLKGSGRIVQANEIAELAWGIENMLNRVIDGTVTANNGMVAVITEARNLMPRLVESFAQNVAMSAERISEIVDYADVLASGGEVDISALSHDAVVSTTPSEQALDELSSATITESAQLDLGDAESADTQFAEVEFNLDNINLDDIATTADSLAETSFEETLEENTESSLLSAANAEPDVTVPSEEDEQSTAYKLFISEVSEHLQIIDVENARVPWTLSEDMARAFHTLAGASTIAGISQVQLIVEPTYQVIETLRGRPNNTGLQAFLAEAAHHLRECFDALRAGTSWEEPLEFVAKADDLLARQPTKINTADLLLGSDITGKIVEAETELRDYLTGHGANCDEMISALGQFVTLARSLEEQHVMQLGDALLQALSRAAGNPGISTANIAVLDEGYETLLLQLNAIAAGSDTKDQAALCSQLLNLEFVGQTPSFDAPRREDDVLEQRLEVIAETALGVPQETSEQDDTHASAEVSDDEFIALDDLFSDDELTALEDDNGTLGQDAVVEAVDDQDKQSIAAHAPLDLADTSDALLEDNVDASPELDSDFAVDSVVDPIVDQEVSAFVSSEAPTHIPEVEADSTADAASVDEEKTDFIVDDQALVDLPGLDQQTEQQIDQFAIDSETDLDNQADVLLQAESPTESTSLDEVAAEPEEFDLTQLALSEEFEPDVNSVQADEPVANTEHIVADDETTTQQFDTVDEDIDDDLVEVFFEEAEEICEELEASIVSWSQERENRLYMETLLRGLHTFKGGARLCGLSGLGDLAHDYESLVIAVQNEERAIDAQLFNDLHQRYDELSHALQTVKHGNASNEVASQEAAEDVSSQPDRTTSYDASFDNLDTPAFAQDIIENDGQSAIDQSADTPTTDELLSMDQSSAADYVTQTASHDATEEKAVTSTESQSSDLLHPDQAVETEASGLKDIPATTLQRSTDNLQGLSAERPQDEVDNTEVRQEETSNLSAERLGTPGDAASSTTPSTPPKVERNSQEMIRVGSALLEDLVNLAGESSILRARIEQGMADFTGSLDEMETTIERLREQLRRLEMETEAQVLFRHEISEGPNYEGFDPLEMDRYSKLQQLSRSLSESASDMLDLKDTLLFKARESETLLLQQARINTELQEGLMRTRMVPFSRMMPRLRRIVRQVSNELDKEVEFHVRNAEGELDRNLLERMIPPLEHLLRNAIDHGIEGKELRRNYGKPSQGRIDLHLSREGGDVVIEVSDDGAGVDIEGVRAKALERGLLKPGVEISDDEITQFILSAGFSTAKSVTQISGRGVGMDVVHSQVKQLGGSINIVSRAGKGTRFIMRLPFTVSVNRALMVSVTDDLYAIPLNTIEGIVLLTPDQLDELYTTGGKTFEYAGIPYRVRYLGQYLGREFTGPAPGQSSIPMVLVRSGDHAVAIHVDLVQGSREIVVKSLGPQFAGVGGISGATILGDGSVVVILDLHALIRAHQHHSYQKPANVAVQPGPRCVLVVDDSVTVRKVTSRLLERQGMDVLVAKDGVEAVAMLQERRPDVMLLDIEMPRMDGFEVARQVRHDERLTNLPIVMISSRTGDKHKEHANELGVNKFLGKPFQENELLATIDELVTQL